MELDADEIINALGDECTTEIAESIRRAILDIHEGRVYPIDTLWERFEDDGA